MPAAIRCVDAVTAHYDVSLGWWEYDWGSDFYRRTGAMMPVDGRTLPALTPVLRADQPIDMVIVRENNEGEYSEIGGRYARGTEAKAAIQEAVFTRTGITRRRRHRHRRRPSG